MRRRRWRRAGRFRFRLRQASANCGSTCSAASRLIFIDHLPLNILTWLKSQYASVTPLKISFHLRISAAFVYGRQLEQGIVIATAPVKAGLQIYVAHVFLFTIFRGNFYVASSFENRCIRKKWASWIFNSPTLIVQAAAGKFRPVNMDVLPLYIVLMLFLPPICG